MNPRGSTRTFFEEYPPDRCGTSKPKKNDPQR